MHSKGDLLRLQFLHSSRKTCTFEYVQLRRPMVNIIKNAVIFMETRRGLQVYLRWYNICQVFLLFLFSP